MEALSAPLQKSQPLSHKLDKVLHIPFDDPSFQLAMEHVALNYSENTPDARRSLRATMERSALSINQQFVNTLNVLNEALAKTEKLVGDVNKSSAQLEAKLNSVNQQASSFIQQTKALEEEREASRNRKVVTEAFLARFTLRDTEVNHLTSPSAEIDSLFFASMQRLEISVENCTDLLGFDSQRAGTEIMDKLARVQDMAFNRLFKWLQTEIRSFTADIPETSTFFKMGMRTLRKRAILFQSCLDELMSTRKVALVHAFLDALTRGGPGGIPKPIEFHAHDPLRYTGDMLAWTHQATASEREFLDGIFDVKREAPGITKEGRLPLSPVETTISISLDKILEASLQPLKGRVEQLLDAQADAVVVYKVINLMEYYGKIICKIVGQNNTLIGLLIELTKVWQQRFFALLAKQSHDILHNIEIPSDELQAPRELFDSLALLRNVLDIYDDSLQSSSSSGLDEIMDLVLDRALESCVLVSTKLELSLSTTDDAEVPESAIFMINCIDAIQTVLQSYPKIQSRVRALSGMTESYCDVLVKANYSEILSRSGLKNIVEVMHQNNGPQDLPSSAVPGLETKSLLMALIHFSDFLSNLDNHINFDKLQSSKIARSIEEQGLLKLLQAYQALHALVLDPINKYEFPESIMSRSVSEVKTILGLSYRQ